MSAAGGSAIAVEGLSVDYLAHRRWREVVSVVSFAIGRREILGLAGESGCGKSTVAYSLLAERRAGSRITAGRVLFEGRDLLAQNEAQLRAIRGARIGFVPQNPTGSLTPSMSCGRQLAEVLAYHGIARGAAARRQAIELLAQMGLPEPPSLYDKYPHQLSGGQQQRVVIAMAVACRPALVVLDEPTTGLDVTTQWRILGLLGELRERFGTALLYVSHDLAALAQICDRIAIMYAGQLVETAPAAELFARPRHPYTRGLLASVPRIDQPPGDRPALSGRLSRENLPAGCRFAPRCDFAEPACTAEPQRLTPPEASSQAAHRVACRRWPAYEAELEPVRRAEKAGSYAG
jgi:peptide/nickel transport system ATP-binding protein